MDVSERLLNFTERIDSMKDSITTEEATKTSLIMPFFSLLGYDVFNPLEFIPEYTADVGLKKGEKVDYAIIIDNKPLIFVECKSVNEDIDKHSSQLIRYFSSSLEAKFAILTNGIIYNFYTDLENPNIMDKTPFLTIDLLNLKDRDINELNKFTKDSLDINKILSSAEDLKYTRAIKEWFNTELENPSINLVKLALSEIYDGVKSQKIIDQFTPLVKRALNQYITDTLNSKIQNAINKNTDDEPEPTLEKQKNIVTTVEELESFGIIKSILRKTVDSSRIFYRDTERYFSVILDDNNRKWICRILLDVGKKHIIISDSDKNGVRYDIDTIDDIFKYSDEIVASCAKYI